MTIAVIDTGIDPDSPEFSGRISSASTDIYGTRGIEGSDDHGNLVSLVAGAARDGTGVLGMAWGSTLLAIRADEPGSCGGDNPEDPTTECGFTDTAIADSIAYAVANDAKVINISLGGPGGLTQGLQNAITNAVSSGVLVVVAAGNDGLSELSRFAQTAGDAGNGGVIVVGSVDEDYQISDFSNRAGQNPEFYLSARGEVICCVYKDGEIFVDDEGFIFLFSGTSFAAPQVAGAAALLAQAFPHLTGTQIAEILFDSAFDAGESGDDAVFGQGILNIAAAFQPAGTTQLAGQQAGRSDGDGAGRYGCDRFPRHGRCLHHRFLAHAGDGQIPARLLHRSCRRPARSRRAAAVARRGGAGRAAPVRQFRRGQRRLLHRCERSSAAAGAGPDAACRRCGAGPRPGGAGGLATDTRYPARFRLSAIG